VTQTYGRPGRQQHAIQVEIDRSIYMNEDTISPNANFMAFSKILRQVIAEIAEIGSEPQRLAAE
jgi:N-formylglutamate deformylase